MKNKNFDSIRLSKIKVNIENNNFWVVPDSWRIFTPKRKDFIVKKAKNLQEIYEINNLHVGNYYFSFNRDHDYKNFNELQKLSWIYDYNENIKIKFYEKTLYKIFKGNAFLINENYFENYVEVLKSKGFKKEEWVFVWNGAKFELD